MAVNGEGTINNWPRSASGPELWARVSEVQDVLLGRHQSVDGPTLYTAQEIASMYRALQQQNAYSQE